MMGMGMGMGYGMGYGGYGGGYGGYGGGYGYGNNSSYYSASSPNANAMTPNAQMAAAATDFEIKGENDFRAGQYQQAATDFKHALVDNPQNAGNGLLLGQSLFAIGQFEQAAAVTAASLNQLPQDKWGAVVTNYKQLYGNQLDYNSQLKALENARDASPDSAGLRFLLGYHFGFLGYPKQAVRELDRAIAILPQEPFAALLRNDFGAKIGLPPVTVPTPPQPPVQTPAATPGQTQSPSHAPANVLPVLSTN
jgi:tetratricopeptide (TPR) repeat protein